MLENILRSKWILPVVAVGAFGFGSVPAVRAITVSSEVDDYGDRAQYSKYSYSAPSTSPYAAPVSTAVATASTAATAEAVAPVSASSVSAAHSIDTLYLSDGKHSLTLTNASGGISFNGMLGKFSLSISSGLATGDALLPTLNVSSAFGGLGTGILTMQFSTTSIGTLPGSVLAGISGNASKASVSYSAYGDSGNRLFGTGTLLGKGGPYTGSAFAGNTTSKFSVPGPFSVTELFIISESKRGSTSFGATIVDPLDDSPLTVPDAGATALLLGLAMLGIVIARQKFATS